MRVKVVFEVRTTKEISDLLGVSEETVRRWIRSGDLKAGLDGKNYLIDDENLELFLQKKAKVSGTSISKMINHLPLAGAGAVAAAAVNPVLGAGILGVAALVNKGLKKSGISKGKLVPEAETQTFELKDIEDYIESLVRKRKKIELEFQMKLLEIEDEIANYEKLKTQILK